MEERFGELVGDLSINLVAITILVFIFFRRHGRRDLVTACAALNVGLFLILTGLFDAATGGVNVAFGFGLFAVLSIIRLRSETTTFTEIAYLFNGLALAVINGIQLNSNLFTAVLSAFVLLTMFVVDHPRLVGSAHRRHLILDEVVTDEARLTSEIERRLGGRVIEVTVSQIDYVRETMQIDVLYVPGPVLPIETATQGEVLR